MYTFTTAWYSLLIATSVVIRIAFAQKTCYSPDGSPSSYTPCQSGADKSGDVACCNLPADTCLVNGLCLWSANGAYYKNGCTDKSWGSFSCANRYLNLPKSCTDTGASSAAQQIFYCHENGDWCCGPVGNGTCCSSSKDHFSVNGVAAVAQSTATASTKSAASTPSGSPGTITATVTASCGSSAPTNSCSGKMAAGAGIGVGATAGVAAVLALGAALLMRERRRARKRDLAKHMGETMGPGIEKTAPNAMVNDVQMAEGSNVPEMGANEPVKAPATELAAGEAEEARPLKSWRNRFP